MKKSFEAARRYEARLVAVGVPAPGTTGPATDPVALAAQEDQRADLARIEERLIAREEKLDVRLRESADRERQIAEREAAVEALRDERIRALESVSGLAASQAKTMLLKDLEDKLRHDAARPCGRSSRRPSARPTAACATSSPSPCSAWPPATPPRPRSRSSTSRPTT